MKLVTSVALCTLMLSSCDPTDKTSSGGTAAATTNTASASSNSGEQYFTFAIDGKPMSIAIDDISMSLGFNGEFKIFAGADRHTSVTITVPAIAKCPCTVAAGSNDASSEIGQGSLSLQHYPNPGNGLNNWYVGRDGTPPGNAIEIKDIGTIVDGARYVTGEFHTTVLRTESNGDGPENRDYLITDGRFRLKFETQGSNGF